MKRFSLLLFIISVVLQRISAQNKIYTSNEYSIFSDSIIQNKFTAKALSDSELISSYQSPANLYQSSGISFKFSINGKDNEMKSGTDNFFYCKDSINETPLIKFGEQLKDTLPTQAIYLKPNTILTIKLDMRGVLTDFNTKGYYVTFNGDKIYKEDFKGIYVAGSTAPMIWDFDNLVNHKELQLQDKDSDGIYETTLILNVQNDKPQTAAHWGLTKDISAFPQYHSQFPIADALYNMSLEEMINAVEPDSTFRTGKLWAGVWTRDISYSIILSMAYLQPEVAKKSLLRKVNKKGKIIQDTGTGGAYPISTDREIWATAAWEVYKATGNKDWLKNAYQIIKSSMDDDLLNAYDKETNLMHGESSFLDWREQTYPKWMQPADIYQSENLGTNAAFYQASIVLSQMASLLQHSKEAIKYKSIADKIKAGINKYLWIKDKGYYAQYLYGRDYKIISPKSEALGEALCVLFNIADKQQQQSIISHVPVTAFGIPCIYPQIPNMPPYHNNAVWPFVESYWGLASAKATNTKSLIEAISAVYRPAAMFLTNKENFVADNGDFAGTQINSSNMLWSLSGNISLIHKIIFGIEFQADSLAFHPFIPKAFNDNRELSDFKYRNAVLDISIEGYGNRIQSFLLDNNKLPGAKIGSDLTGNHSVKIVMENNNLPEEKINKVKNYTSPETPTVSYTYPTLSWQPVKDVLYYIILKNGKEILHTTKTGLNVTTNSLAEYSIVAVDKNAVQSFASEPVMVVDKKYIRIYEIENQIKKSTLPYKDFSGDGFSEISKAVNTTINISIDVDSSGVYAIDFRYANGNGPVNTSNKCAMRALNVDNKFSGTIVFPQRGNDEWSNWGFSNSAKVHLAKGTHILSLIFQPQNENMNGDINQAMLDYLRVIKLE
jgi:hypothetical protein